MRVEPQNYGESILLAVSGGIDSMVMADLICHNHRITSKAVAHCNFHLRGTESDSDETLVREWCEKNNVKLYCKDFDTAAFATENGISTEMAARELRYRWFDELCRSEGFDGVCVAHNADDNAETLLLNLVRGTGLRGLCAMSECSRNPYGDTLVFRPMLRFTRAEIESYAREHGIVWHTDSTNLHSDYKRNFIRNEVMPMLCKLNPSILHTLNTETKYFTQNQNVVDEYLKLSLEHLSIADAVRSCRPVRIVSASLLSLPQWEYVLYRILDMYGFNSAVINDVIESLKAENSIFSGKTFEAYDWRLVTTSTELVIVPAEETPIAEPLVELLDWTATMIPCTARGIIIVDAAKIGEKPCWRRWRDGDWLRPIGLKGRKKVSDMLTDLKYNLFEKSKALVLVPSSDMDTSHVLAVLGERIDDSVKVTASTRQVYRISNK